MPPYTAPAKKVVPFRGLPITLADYFLPNSSVLCDIVDNNKGPLTKKSTEGCPWEAETSGSSRLAKSQAVHLNGYYMPPVIDVQMHSTFGRFLVSLRRL